MCNSFKVKRKPPGFQLPHLKERKADMSENNTAETNDSRSFEERVFLRFDAVDARFDAVDERFDRVDARFESLENRVEKQYDTKPIWEAALKAISQTDSRVEVLGNRVEQIGIKLAETDAKVEQLGSSLAQTDAKVEQLRSDMKTEFATLRDELDDSFRGVEWKIEALNENMLKLQADQKYTRRRLQDLESQTKPK